MAMSLAVEKPSVRHVGKLHKAVLGDPTGSTEAKIWLLAVLPALALVLLGLASMLLKRTGVVVTSLGAIALSIALLVPLGGWANGHTDRYPLGVDLIRPELRRGTSTCAASGRPTRNARPSSLDSRRCRSPARPSQSFSCSSSGAAAGSCGLSLRRPR